MRIAEELTRSNSKKTVFLLASWYPHKKNFIDGIFIKRHARAISKYVNVVLLYIHIGDEENDLQITRQGGLTEIIVYRKQSEYHNGLIKQFVDLIIYTIGFLKALKVIKRKMGKPDLVHVHVIYPCGLFAIFFKFICGIPYLVTEHWSGYLEEDGRFYHYTPLKRALITFVAQHAIAITTVSQKLRDAMIQCGIQNKFYLVPNVIEGIEKNWENSPKEKKGPKKKILHVSLLINRIKNISGIIEAVNLLSQLKEDFEFHIIGDGCDRKMLEDLASHYGLTGNVIFFHGMKSHDEVLEFMKSSHFFILNSNFETFSIVLAEALSCGLPVISTRCGGPEEFINDLCGILIEPDNVKTLAEAIDFMLDHCTQYDSKKIHEYAANLFSNDKVSKQFYEIYKKYI